MPINILINGAQGKMGRTTVAAIANEKDLRLVATTSRHDDLTRAIQAHKADVVIDFTLPDCVFENAQKIIAAGSRPVIGTSGLTQTQIETLAAECVNKKRGGIIAPNFSIGAILMMHFSKEAARYFPDAEIIEYHHPQKVDAPSATAKKTAELIAESKREKNKSAVIDAAKKQSARGEHYQGVPIHAIRMSGMFASQSVIFSDHDEMLTLQHETRDRRAMMPGVFLCCRQVMTLDHLVYGMESFLQKT